MKKLLLLILIVLLASSCSIQRSTSGISAAKRSQLEKEWKQKKALTVFSVSEYLRAQGEYTESFQWLVQAEKFDPESIYLKERIFDYLFIRAKSDSLKSALLLNLGNTWYNQGIYSSEILYKLGKVNIWQGNTKAAGKYFSESLQYEDALLEYYITYYLFQEEYAPPADSTLLNRMLELEWEDENQGIIYHAADIYKAKGNIIKARDILLKAYNKWNNLQVLLNVVALNQQLGDWNLNKELMDQRYTLQNDLPTQLVEYLISLYFDSGEYQKVVDMENDCRATGNEMIMKMLFLSALETGSYDLSYSIAELLISAGYIDKDYYASIYGSLARLDLSMGNWEEAINNFIKVDDVIDKLAVLYELLAENGKNEITGTFLEDYYKITESEENEALFLLLIYNLETARFERVPQLLSLIDKTIFEDNRILMALANSFDDTAYFANGDYMLLEMELAEYPSFLGLFYYYLNQNEAAEKTFANAWQTKGLNEAALLAYCASLEENDQNQKLMSILDWGSSRYPQNADILNFYGYQIAVLQKSALYPLAKDLLIKALEINPDNAMYWDSLGWLYYRMENYNQALDAMTHTLKQAEAYSEIAWHLGMIHYQLTNYHKAEYYLQIALNLEHNQDFAGEIKAVLDKIQQKLEE